MRPPAVPACSLSLDPSDTRLQSLMLLMTLASLLCLVGKAGQEVTDNVNSKVPRIPHDRLASGWYIDFQEQPQDQ